MTSAFGRAVARQKCDGYAYRWRECGAEWRGTREDGGVGVRCVAAVMLVLVAAVSGVTTARPGTEVDRRLYVDPENPAAVQMGAWNGMGRHDDARTIAVIAREPTATWLTGAPQSTLTVVRRISLLAARAHRIPVFVV